ncbi:multicopper oxidase family protein [Methylocystis echinoides]|uniref:multicopper oxidase family protein n=1 Tax=Methylocystis echinoides TaxID=29468 RepID=UPI003441A850
MLSRRALLRNAAALAAASACPARAEAPLRVLKLQRKTIEVAGRPASVYAIAGADGEEGFTANVGGRFRVRVENALDEPSLVHWHGLAPPWRQDGVPEISGPAIPPGGAADYDFPLGFGGTYYMHSHYGLQEQLLFAAPLIVKDPRRFAQRQEIVVMLADFSFASPQEIYAGLVATGSRHGASRMKMRMGKEAAARKTAAPDLNDVAYDAFLANERTIDAPDVIPVEAGGRILLRLVNSASMSNFRVDLGALDGSLVAVDGQDVVPVTGRSFPIAVAQRLDILVDLPKGARAFPICFVLEGERRQAAVILSAPGAPIEKLPQAAAEPAAALDLALESQLRAASPLAARKADRTIPIDLTGDMARYVWSIDNRVWNDRTPPYDVKAGERVELALTNKTMMSHPMHLHGHRFQVIEIDGTRFAGALRDTVLVPPGKRVVIAFDADNPGRWAFHCHLLYHAQAGMFASLRYV